MGNNLASLPGLSEEAQRYGYQHHNKDCPYVTLDGEYTPNDLRLILAEIEKAGADDHG